MNTIYITYTLVFITILISWYTVSRLVYHSRKMGLIDIPNERSSHDKPVPRGGGIGIVVALLLAIAAAYLTGIMKVELGFLSGIIISIVLLSGVGLADDKFNVTPLVKFVCQFLAALSAIMLCGSPEYFIFPMISFNAVVFILTLLWLVAVSNFYNFMDGIDGLAGVQGVVAGIFIVIFGWMIGDSVVMLMGAFLGAATLGFLVFNYPPAKIFMGDVGSYVIGFYIALIAVIRPVLWVPVALLLGVFIYDTVVTLVRRIAKGEKWYEAHKIHFYQRAVTCGYAHRQVTICLGLVSVLFGGLGCLCVGASWNIKVAAIVLAIGLMTGLSMWIMSKEKSPESVNKKKIYDINVFNAAYNVVQRYRQVTIFLTYTILFASSFLLSLILFYDFAIPAEVRLLILKTSLGFVVVKLAVFYLFGLHLGMWRYTTIHDLIKLTAASTISSVVLFSLFYFRHGVILFKTVFITDWMISIIVIGGMRMIVRFMREWRLTFLKMKTKSTIIVGAGDAGAMLLKEIKNNPKMEYHVVGFVDDDNRKRKLKIMGCPVLGSIAELPLYISVFNVSEIIIAMPALDHEDIRNIADICKEKGIVPKTLPSMSDIVQRKLYSQIHEVNPEDMLFREKVDVNKEALSGYINGKTIMVTGAAGSIGSELVMQIAKLNPAKVVLYDINENNLFLTEIRLKEFFPYIDFESRVGSVLDKMKLKEIISQTQPRVIYHAAAYKHVPMMEKDPIEAVRNNIFGTKTVAEVASECQIEKMVFISTDKAVNPVNVMGATKRACELMLMHKQDKTHTSYVIVRFGNVLGSNGSVIPLIKEQIRIGGPVKVTHPDIERFFMTISEAVQLTMEASVIGSNGDVFILDMGKPVRIKDLAENLIKMSGADNIEIDFIGLRPGEKLKEELWYQYEAGESTTNAKIFHVGSNGNKGINAEDIDRDIDSLLLACQDRDVGLLLEGLRNIVREFRPSAVPGQVRPLKEDGGKIVTGINR